MSKASQQESLTDVQKGKLLREARKRLKWNQDEAGKALNLDPSYVSQLENGRRPVDFSYVEKLRDLEKSNQVKAQRAEDSLYSDYSLRTRCHDYLNEVLDACEADEDRLRWTYVELQRRFPIPVTVITKHGIVQTEHADLRGVNSKVAERLKAGVAPVVGGSGGSEGSQTSASTVSPSENKPAPSDPAHPVKGQKSATPKPAPK